jgi:hypothetical protein
MAHQFPPGRNAGWVAAAGFPVILTHNRVINFPERCASEMQKPPVKGGFAPGLRRNTLIYRRRWRGGATCLRFAKSLAASIHDNNVYNAFSLRFIADSALAFPRGQPAGASRPVSFEPRRGGFRPNWDVRPHGAQRPASTPATMSRARSRTDLCSSAETSTKPSPRSRKIPSTASRA